MSSFVSLTSGTLPFLAECAQLPLASLAYLVPALRPHRGWSLNHAVRLRLVRWFLSLAYATNMRPPMSLEPGAERDRFEVVPPIDGTDSDTVGQLADAGLAVGPNRSAGNVQSQLYAGPLVDDEISPGPVGVTWYPARPRKGDITPGMDVVLHFHGGAYVIGDGRDGDAGFLSRGILRNSNVRYVMSAQYRLASYQGGRFPAALQDGLTCYLHLIGSIGVAPDRITLSGDSAGANLVLGMLRYIESADGRQAQIPRPACAWLWSPWVDVGAASLPGIMTQSPNFVSDYLTPEFAMWGALLVSVPTTKHAGYIGGQYLSPQRHPFKTPVPMFLHVGSAEVLYHPVVDFYRRYTGGRATVTPADDPAQFCHHPNAHLPAVPVDDFALLAGPIPAEGAGNNIKLVVSDGAPHDIALIGHVLGWEQEYYDRVVDAAAFMTKNRFIDKHSNQSDGAASQHASLASTGKHVDGPAVSAIPVQTEAPIPAGVPVHTGSPLRKMTQARV